MLLRLRGLYSESQLVLKSDSLQHWRKLSTTLRKCVGSPSDAYEPGGRAAAELKGVEAPEDVTFDLALAAAFTSMSLRDRCRDPGVDTDFVLTVEALDRVGEQTHNQD